MKKFIRFFVTFLFITLIVVFIYGCYNFEFLRKNQYIRQATDKVDAVIYEFTKQEGYDDYVENYELDVVDSNSYEINGKQDRYYYNQIDINSKIIYMEILNNLDRIKKGEDNIRISSRLSSLAEEGDLTENLLKAFQNAWDAFRNDNPDVFYIDGSKMCLVTKTIKQGGKTSYQFFISRGENQNYLINEFSNEEDVESAIKFVEEQEQEILKVITDENDYYKILKVHNGIIGNLSYNQHEDKNNANIYGALKNKAVVCEGYARLFKSLLDKLDVPCVFVSGKGTPASGTTENHAWNYVYLKGKWYAVDATWDDPVIIGNGKVSNDLKYRYFLMGQNEFFKTHEEEGKLVENGMTFKYPDLSEENYVATKK